MLGLSATERTHKTIQTMVKTINKAWIKGRGAELDSYLHEDMVMIMPGFSAEVNGKAACIDSYVEFARNADVLRYEEVDVSIQTWGDTAVVYYDFEIEYAMAGERFAETGQDVMIFTYEMGSWKVVWRTLLGNLNET